MYVVATKDIIVDMGMLPADKDIEDLKLHNACNDSWWQMKIFLLQAALSADVDTSKPAPWPSNDDDVFLSLDLEWDPDKQGASSDSHTRRLVIGDLRGLDQSSSEEQETLNSLVNYEVNWYKNKSKIHETTGRMEQGLAQCVHYLINGIIRHNFGYEGLIISLSRCISKLFNRYSSNLDVAEASP